jgi:ribosomal protein L11 methyltransferase
MEQYLALTVHIGASEESESLLAFLAEAGFDGMEELADRLIAYRADNDWDRSEVDAYLADRGLSYSYELMEKTNWNQLWESNFEPVQVDDFVGMRASFHPPFLNVQHELIITPKMSFGTGHHATTRLMIQAMRDQVVPEARVLDFGTGTGVLAILAKKMGAGHVVGIDVEDWSVENAIENAQENKVNDIVFVCADRITNSGPFDLVLANINRNILLEHLSALQTVLAPSGRLIMSGIIEEDLPVMDQALVQQGFQRVSYAQEKGWICIQLIHNQSNLPY